MRINSVLQHEFTPNSVLEKTSTAQNIKMNGILVDFRFTPDAEYISGNATKSPYRVLNNIILNANLRTSSGNGKNSLLVDRVPTYLLLEYSDFVGGVDATLEPMTAGKEWRVSGYLPIGYLEVGDNDSLDFQLYCKENPEITSKIYISTVYTTSQAVNIMAYSRVRPTGSSQTYENVQSAFITTDQELNDTVSITDQLNNEIVNIESAIAYSNAYGHFEKFKRFGQIYSDVHDVGQTVTLICPTDNEDTQILLVKYVFNLGLQVVGNSDTQSARRNLFTQIAQRQPEKFQFLKNMGVNVAGVVAVSN